MVNRDLERLPENRRKRINRLKKMIIAVVIAAIVIPVIVCIVLAVCLHNTKNDLNETRQQLEELQKLYESSRDNEVGQNVDAEGQDAASNASAGSGNSLINSDTALTSTGNENANSSQDAETADGKKRVYLTFDDGPSNNTEEILDILNKYDVKATFFVVGNTSEHGQELLKRIVSEGHSVGLHSYSHKYASIYDSEDAFLMISTRYRIMYMKQPVSDPISADCREEAAIPSARLIWLILSGNSMIKGLNAMTGT